MLRLSKKAVSPVIAIVLLLMMTVAAAGAAYFWITSMQSSVQQSAGSQIEAITKQASTRIIAQATLCKPPAEDDLVGYWKFDQGEGTTAEDSAGDNDGTLEDGNNSNSDEDTPPQWVKYGSGYALEFDGTDDYVEYGDVIDGLDEITITGWLKANGQEHKDEIVNKPFTYGVSMWGDDGLKFSVAFANGSGAYMTIGSGIKQKKWNFFTCKYNETHLITRINNEIWIKDSYDNLNIDDTGKTLIVGRDLNSSVDEVRIYDKALTGEKVKSERVDVTVYNAGAEAVPEGTWVANLIKNGNTIESDTYNASRLDSEERTMLNFYFSKLHPGGEYKIELEGTETSTTVSC